MFSFLSKITSIQSISTRFFTKYDVNYFYSYTYIGYETYTSSFSEILTPSDVPSTFEDDVPTIVHAPPTNELPLRMRNPPTYLRDYHCFYTMFHLHEPYSYKEAYLYIH